MVRYLKPLMISLLVTYLAFCFLGAISFVESSLRLNKRKITAAESTIAHQRAAALKARIEDVETQSPDGLKLKGWYIRPQNATGASVLLLHGLTDNRLGMSGFAELFLKHGYAVLLPDMRTHGESEGELATYGLLEAGDVHSWVDWLYHTERPSCVYGVGSSMGAAIVLQSLVKESRFCAVVAEAPFSDFREAVYDRIGERFQTGPWLGRTVLRPVVEAGMVYARMRYGLDFSENSPRAAVASSKTPVLLIHGAQDSVLRVRNSQAIHDANRKTIFWEVPDAGHGGVWNAHPQDFEMKLLDWCQVRAVPAPV